MLECEALEMCLENAFVKFVRCCCPVRVRQCVLDSENNLFQVKWEEKQDDGGKCNPVYIHI